MTVYQAGNLQEVAVNLSFSLLDIAVGFTSTFYTIPESQGYVDVCVGLHISFSMDLPLFNLTVSIGFSQGNTLVTGPQSPTVIL